MGKKDRLEPLDDGFVAFHTESGERWKHRDVVEVVTGPGHRLFVSDSGDERRYYFGPKEPHDATLHDLRRQLAGAARGSATSAARDGGSPPP